MESLKVLLEQSVGHVMSANSAGSQMVIQNMYTSGTVINSDLVKSTITNPDTLAEVVSAASAHNTTTKLNMPPAAPDMSLAYYQQLRALSQQQAA